MKNPLLAKPKMKIYLLLLAAAAGMMVALGKCQRQYAPTKTGASEGDTIDVAIEYSPMSLYMYEDTLGGFYHDLLQLIARRYGVSVKMHPMTSLQQSLEMLDNGNYDIVAAQVPATSDFKDKYRFSDAIYIDNQVLVQKTDSAGQTKIKSQLDLAGQTVCVTKGSPAVTRLHNLAREIGDSITICELDYSPEQLFLLIAAGEQQLAVVNDKTARPLVAEHPDINISTDISFNQFQSWVIRKDDVHMADSLNRWLRDIRKTPDYKTLSDRYLNN